MGCIFVIRRCVGASRHVPKPRLIEVYSPLLCTVVIRVARLPTRFAVVVAMGVLVVAVARLPYRTSQGGRRQASSEGWSSPG